jgi:YD repeat-containing protein
VQIRLRSLAALCTASLCGIGVASAEPMYDCRATATVYDGLADVVITATGSAACTTSTYYDATVSLGGQLRAAEPLGSTNITSTTYDSRGRLVSDMGGFATANMYDSFGRLMTATDPSGTERYFYDVQGRLSTETGPAPITQTMYDALGRVTSLDDGMGHVTTYQYDPLGRLMEVMGPSGTTTYTYDPLGRLLAETTPTDITSYMYDAFGRVSEITDTQSNVVQFQYDTTMGLLDLVDTNGFITTYSYSNELLSGASDPTGKNGLIYTAPIPEPSSIVILVPALFGLLGAFRRRLSRSGSPQSASATG